MAPCRLPLNVCQAQDKRKSGGLQTICQVTNQANELLSQTFSILWSGQSCSHDDLEARSESQTLGLLGVLCLDGRQGRASHSQPFTHFSSPPAPSHTVRGPMRTRAIEAPPPERRPLAAPRSPLHTWRQSFSGRHA